MYPVSCYRNCGVLFLDGNWKKSSVELYPLNCWIVTLVSCVCSAGNVPNAAPQWDGRGGRRGGHEPVPDGPLRYPRPIPWARPGDAVRGAGPPGPPHLPPDAAPVYDPGLAGVCCLDLASSLWDAVNRHSSHAWDVFVQVCRTRVGGAEAEAEAGRHSAPERCHDGGEETGSPGGAVQTGASCRPAGRMHPGTPENGIGLTFQFI